MVDSITVSDAVSHNPPCSRMALTQPLAVLLSSEILAGIRHLIEGLRLVEKGPAAHWASIRDSFDDIMPPRGVCLHELAHELALIYNHLIVDFFAAGVHTAFQKPPQEFAG